MKILKTEKEKQLQKDWRKWERWKRLHGKKKHRTYKRIWIPQVIAILMLMWAFCFPDNPYVYYSILRWVCCAVFTYLAFRLGDNYTDPLRRWTPWRGRVYTLYWRCEDEAS